MTTPEYPQDPAAWRAAIARAFDRSEAHLRSALRSGDFPFLEFEAWIRNTYNEDAGFAAAFVPALLRNQHGLLAWAFLGAPEPYWPGSDDDPKSE